jgi:hypothetical protein
VRGYHKGLHAHYYTLLIRVHKQQQALNKVKEESQHRDPTPTSATSSVIHFIQRLINRVYPSTAQSNSWILFGFLQFFSLVDSVVEENTSQHNLADVIEETTDYFFNFPPDRDEVIGTNLIRNDRFGSSPFTTSTQTSCLSIPQISMIDTKQRNMDSKQSLQSQPRLASNKGIKGTSSRQCLENTQTVCQTMTNDQRPNFEASKYAADICNSPQQVASSVQLNNDLPQLSGNVSSSTLSLDRTSQSSTDELEMPPKKKKDLKRNKNKKGSTTKAESKVLSSSKSEADTIQGSNSTAYTFVSSAASTNVTSGVKEQAPALSLLAPISPTCYKIPVSSIGKTDYNQDELEDVPLGDPPTGLTRGMDPTEDTDYDTVEDKNLKAAVGIVAQQGGKILKKGLLDRLFRR